MLDFHIPVGQIDRILGEKFADCQAEDKDKAPKRPPVILKLSLRWLPSLADM